MEGINLALLWLQVCAKLSQRQNSSELPGCPGKGSGPVEGMCRSVVHPVIAIVQSCEPEQAEHSDPLMDS